MRPSSRRDETPFLGAHRHAPGLTFRTSKGKSWRPPWEDPHAGGPSAIETTGKASVGQSTGAAEESRDIGARSRGGKRLQVFEIPALRQGVHMQGTPRVHLADSLRAGPFPRRGEVIQICDWRKTPGARLSGSVLIFNTHSNL